MENSEKTDLSPDSFSSSSNNNTRRGNNLGNSKNSQNKKDIKKDSVYSKGFRDGVASVSSISIPSQAKSNQSLSDYIRTTESESPFAYTSPLYFIDPITFRVHRPFVGINWSVNPCGATGSVYNNMFCTCIEHLVDSPRWLNQITSNNLVIDTSLITMYFNFVAETLAFSTITKSMIYLYDKKESGYFEKDTVSKQVMNNYFSSFVPRRKEFITTLRDIDNELANWSLPPDLQNLTQECFKINSLPYSGNEVMIINSIDIIIDENALSRNYIYSGPSLDDSIAITYPYDSVLNADPSNQYNRNLSLLKFLKAKLIYLNTVGCEFFEINTLLRKLLPEYEVKPEDLESFVGVIPLPRGKDLFFTNQVPVLPSRPNILFKEYLYYNSNSLKKKTNLPFIDYDGVYKVGTYETLRSVTIDDEVYPNSSRIDTFRDYDRTQIWFNGNKPFNYSEGEMLYMSLPFNVSNPMNSRNLKQIVEPGVFTLGHIVSPFPAMHMFGKQIINDVQCCINISHPNNKLNSWDEHDALNLLSFIQYIVSAPSSLDAKAKDEWKDKESEKTDLRFINVSNISINVERSSRPDLRKVDLDFNRLSNLLINLAHTHWFSQTLLTTYESRLPSDIRSNFVTYKVNVLT